MSVGRRCVCARVCVCGCGCVARHVHGMQPRAGTRGVPCAPARKWPLDTLNPNPARFKACESLLSVRASTVPAAGLGVFARAPIKRDTPLGYYTGELITATEEAAMYPDPAHPATYVLRVRRSDGGHVSVDAANVAHWTKYINDPHGNAGLTPNVSFQDNGLVVAVRDIPREAELLVSYGEGYWAHTPEEAPSGAHATYDGMPSTNIWRIPRA